VIFLFFCKILQLDGWKQFHQTPADNTSSLQQLGICDTKSNFRTFKEGGRFIERLNTGLSVRKPLYVYVP